MMQQGILVFYPFYYLNLIFIIPGLLPHEVVGYQREATLTYWSSHQIDTGHSSAALRIQVTGHSSYVLRIQDGRYPSNETIAVKLLYELHNQHISMLKF